MKSRMVALISTITLFAALAITPTAWAQQQDGEGLTSTPNPVPLISQSLVPDAIKPGGKTFTLTVNGTGFVAGSVVHWNGNARATTFVSTSKLTANIPASDIATVRTASVTVVSPGPGGGTSNVMFFPITVPTSFVALGRSDYTTGSNPAGVTTGDFNGDGKLDIAQANFYGNTVSVLLGNGDGTFQTHVDYATGIGPDSVVVGDFNRDGKLDLAVLSQGSNAVSVLLGNGDGTFRPAANYAAGLGDGSLAVGDFNGDGKLDLASTSSSGDTVSVLLGNGDGTFREHVDYATGSGPYGVGVGDFNRDGKLDLAVADMTGGTISILLGNGDGTFQAHVEYETGSGANWVSVADLNADGALDLIVPNQDAMTVSILLGNGNGTFQPHVDYAVPAGANRSAVGDFNGDGKTDLVIGPRAASDVVSILLGNGDGTFQAPVKYATGVDPIGVAVGDFNGDGRLDLAVADNGASAVSVLLQSTVSLSTAGLRFADQLIHTSSAPENITLTNIGPLALSIDSIAITGTDANDFSQTHTCGSSVPPQESCTITVTFTPTLIGPRNTSITITDNAEGGAQSIALSGTGVVSGPNVTLSTTSLTFATQLVGTTSQAQSVTLTNYGRTTLDITRMIATGDFSQSNTCGSSLAPSASCTISVTFRPKQRGTRVGMLSITDNAPNSPQTVALSGTGTVVKLDPSSLGFHCSHRQNNCPPPPQSAILTNIGSGPLTIGHIYISGAYFSETNTCPAILAANQACTITVRFNPLCPLMCTSSGDVSVNDNGGGSPQQVTLTGNKVKNGMRPAALSALSTTQTASVPSPTGPSMVGTRIVQMVDPLRDDPFLGSGTKRELMVRFWYPASISEGCEPATYTSPAVWGYFSHLTGFPLPEVRTNSCLDASISEGSHPVVVFTHGYTGTFTDYTYLFEDLASRGYVVAAVDHTYEATAVEFPDGRMVKSVFGSHLAESTWRRDGQSLSAAVSVRLKDLKFVVDELTRLNGELGGPFADKLDLSKVAVAGHSLGGLAALRSVQQEARFKAAVLLDATMQDGSARVTETPALVLAMGRMQWSDEECRLWSDLRGPRFAVNLIGAEHVTPSDAVWLAKGTVKTGSMGPEKTIAAMRDYIAAFLDKNLRGNPTGRLLTGPSPEYPDADVTTQEQPLCRRP